VVAAILHLGNLEFKVKGDDELRVTKACDAHLAAAAHLLGYESLLTPAGVYDTAPY